MPSLIASSTRASTLVSGRLSAYRAMAGAAVTSSCPGETARVNPNPRRAFSIAVNTDPEWVIRATGPAGTGSGRRYPTASSPRARFTKPMHPAPQRAMPASLAVAASRSLSPVDPGGSKALPKMMAERALARAAAASCSSSAVSGTASTARSTGSGRSARLGRQGAPPMSEYRGFTRWVRGRDELRATSWIMCAPRLPGRALAPTRAMLRASSIALTVSSVCRRGQGRRRHRRPGRRIAGLRMAGFWTAVRRSAIAALAACMPGMPHTPPPAWVAELA